MATVGGGAAGGGAAGGGAAGAPVYSPSCQAVLDDVAALAADHGQQQVSEMLLLAFLRAMRGAGARLSFAYSPSDGLCAFISHAQGSSGVVATMCMSFARRGRTKSPASTS